MVVNRLSGFVLPWASKYLVDTVLADGKMDMLLPIALAVGGATIVGAITNFSPLPDYQRDRTGCHHEYAPPGASARDPASHPVF